MIKGLYAIVGSHLHFSPSKMAELCLEGGTKIIQLRMKNKNRNEILSEGQKIFSLKKKYSFVFIVNDDPDLALELKADGVHLGQEDLSHVGARRALPLRDAGKIVGVSMHSIDDVVGAIHPSSLKLRGTRELLLHGYMALGAIFKSPTKNKKNHPVVGIELLKQVVTISPVPVVAIGGIDRNNIDQVIQTGVDAVALISALDREGRLTTEKEIQEEVRFFSEKFF